MAYTPPPAPKPAKFIKGEPRFKAIVSPLSQFNNVRAGGDEYVKSEWRPVPVEDEREVFTRSNLLVIPIGDPEPELNLVTGNKSFEISCDYCGYDNVIISAGVLKCGNCGAPLKRKNEPIRYMIKAPQNHTEAEMEKVRSAVQACMSSETASVIIPQGWEIYQDGQLIFGGSTEPETWIDYRCGSELSDLSVEDFMRAYQGEPVPGERKPPKPWPDPPRRTERPAPTETPSVTIR